MTARCKIDPAHSRFTVQAFAAGMLSFLGHNPTFAVRDFAGEIVLDPAAPENASVQVAVKADSLQLVDNVSAADRRQIEDTMRREALETAAYPEIAFQGAGVAAGPPSGDERPLRITGQMSLHGVARPMQVDARLTLYTDGVRLAGAFLLLQSDYRIRPVVALGGTLTLKDPVQGSFDFACWKENQ